MKPTTHHTLALLLAFALWGCAAHDEPADAPHTTAPLQISGASIGSGLTTYADEPDNFLGSGKSIGIFLQAQNGYQAVNNRLYTYATPFWQTDEQLLLTTTTVSLAAYYPYAAALGQNPVLLRSGIYAADNDLSYLPFTANSTSRTLKLALKHAYSRLKVTIVVHADNANVNITRLRIAGAGIRSVAQLDLFKAEGATGSITDVPGASPSIDVPISQMGGTKEHDLLMIPGTLLGDITFGVVHGGRTIQATVAAATLCGTPSKLLPGTVYGIKLTVLPYNQLAVGGVTITSGWDEVTVGGGNGSYGTDYD